MRTRAQHSTVPAPPLYRHSTGTAYCRRSPVVLVVPQIKSPHSIVSGTNTVAVQRSRITVNWHTATTVLYGVPGCALNMSALLQTELTGGGSIFGRPKLAVDLIVTVCFHPICWARIIGWSSTHCHHHAGPCLSRCCHTPCCIPSLIALSSGLQSTLTRAIETAFLSFGPAVADGAPPYIATEVSRPAWRSYFRSYHPVSRFMLTPAAWRTCPSSHSISSTLTPPRVDHTAREGASCGLYLRRPSQPLHAQGGLSGR